MPDPMCTVEDCSRLRSTKQYCQGHYLRVKKHGVPMADVPLGNKPPKPVCSADGCDNDAQCKALCWVHYGRWKRYGDPMAHIPIGQRIPPRKIMPPCAVKGCERPSKTKGYCKGHYQRWLRTGDIAEGVAFSNPPQQCSAGDCKRMAESQGYCDGHYQRLRKKGDAMPGMPLLEKFGITVDICEVDGCRNSPKARNMCQKHYARFMSSGSTSTLIRNMDHGDTCEIDGCDRPYLASGMCSYHVRIESDRRNWKRVRERAHHRRALLRRGYISNRDLERLLSSECLACGSRDNIQIDHLIPIIRGGHHAVGNLAPLCAPCNGSKHSLTWTEWKYSDRPRACAVFGPTPPRRTGIPSAPLLLQTA